MSSRGYPVPGAWDDSWDLTDSPTPATANSVPTAVPAAASLEPVPTPQGGNRVSSKDGTSSRRKAPVMIAMLGRTGTGKSSFIKAATGKDIEIGHGLESRTQEVLEVPCTIDGREVVLIDTPGFSDTHLSDTEILRRIAEWLQDKYDEHSLLSGIIYLHSIADNRMEGPSLRNLRMMEKLCGTEMLPNVVLATTMWEKETPDIAERREQELEQSFWQDLIKRDAKTARLTNQSREEALRILKMVIKNSPTTTALQTELSTGRPLAETAAGREILHEIAMVEHRLTRIYEADLRELREAQQNSNARIEQELKEGLANTQSQLRKLENDRTRMNEGITPRVKRGGFLGWGSYRCRVCGEKTRHVGTWNCTGCGRRQKNVW